MFKMTIFLSKEEKLTGFGCTALGSSLDQWLWGLLYCVGGGKDLPDNLDFFIELKTEDLEIIYFY